MWHFHSVCRKLKKLRYDYTAINIQSLLIIANIGNQQLLVIPDQVRLNQKNTWVYWICWLSFFPKARPSKQPRQTGALLGATLQMSGTSCLPCVMSSPSSCTKHLFLVHPNTMTLYVFQKTSTLLYFYLCLQLTPTDIHGHMYMETYLNKVHALFIYTDCAAGISLWLYRICYVYTKWLRVWFSWAWQTTWVWLMLYGQYVISAARRLSIKRWK